MKFLINKYMKRILLVKRKISVAIEKYELINITIWTIFYKLIKIW
jgi:hypothetical protein